MFNLQTDYKSNVNFENSPKFLTTIGTFPVVALMTGDAIGRITGEMDFSEICNFTSVNGTMDVENVNASVCAHSECEQLKVDIAVSLSLLVGILMVSDLISLSLSLSLSPLPRALPPSLPFSLSISSCSLSTPSPPPPSSIPLSLSFPSVPFSSYHTSLPSSPSPSLTDSHGPL